MPCIQKDCAGLFIDGIRGVSVKRLGVLIVMCVLLLPAAGLADTYDFVAAGAAGNTWSWSGGALSANSGNNYAGDATVSPNYYDPNITLIVNGEDLSLGSYLYGSNFLFTTGALQGINSNGEYVFAPGGSISITNDVNDDCGGAPCFTGTFTGSQTIIYDPATNTLTIQGVMVAGNLSSVLMSTVATWNPETGVNPNGSTQSSGYFTATLQLGSGVTFDPQTGGCGNLPSCGTFVSGVLDPENVPEPGSLMLFGSGLLGLAGYLRRKLFSR